MKRHNEDKTTDLKSNVCVFSYPICQNLRRIGPVSLLPCTALACCLETTKLVLLQRQLYYKLSSGYPATLVTLSALLLPVSSLTGTMKKDIKTPLHMTKETTEIVKKHQGSLTHATMARLVVASVILHQCNFVTNTSDS